MSALSTSWKVPIAESLSNADRRGHILIKHVYLRPSHKSFRIQNCVSGSRLRFADAPAAVCHPLDYIALTTIGNDMVLTASHMRPASTHAQTTASACSCNVHVCRVTVAWFLRPALRISAAHRPLCGGSRSRQLQRVCCSATKEDEAEKSEKM